MIIKSLKDEDFVNYKKPSMIIGFPKCDFKCDRECGQQVCQNSALATAPDIEINTMDLVKRYIDNPITKAVCCQGLEPFDSFGDLWTFIFLFRSVSDDDIVIYTGYNKNEIIDYIQRLSEFSNIVIKFGRYIPGQEPHYDEVLGVKLASDNQYAEKIS